MLKCLEMIFKVFVLGKCMALSTEAMQGEWPDDVGKWKVILRQKTACFIAWLPI